MTPRYDAAALVDGARRGERSALARLITLFESRRADHRLIAEDALRLLAPHAGGALRLGISGPPGAGKSTFIERLGVDLLDAGRRPAVLAVDPSSGKRGGAILGDKTRMPKLAADLRAFVRPSPSGGKLGGVARATREAIAAVEAAGFDIVIVETVGAGQNEFVVADMVDFFLLLLPPASGDELQGVKKGVVELADMVAINKADGDMLPRARTAASEYSAALRLVTREDGWSPPVRTVSAVTGDGVAALWETVEGRVAELRASGGLEAMRANQREGWLWAAIEDQLIDAFRSHPNVAAAAPDIAAAVRAGAISAAEGARRLLDGFRTPAG
ncbi:MAG: methylmalonyl Co-A mutase-associated GTPase MeaB [Pseudomonadota bacterium]